LKDHASRPAQAKIPPQPIVGTLPVIPSYMVRLSSGESQFQDRSGKKVYGTAISMKK
jgi:hypothetical protein